MDAIEDLDAMRSQQEHIFGTSDDAYRLLLDTLPSGIVVVDGRGTVLFANNAFARALLFSRAEVERKKNIADFIGKDDLEKVVHLHESMKEDPSNSPRMSEIRIIDRHGGLHTTVITTALIPRTENMMITGLDLGGQPRTGDPDPVPEGLFRTMFEHSGAGTIVLDRDTRIVLANPAFCQLLGYAREDVEGKLALFDIVGGEDKTRLFAYPRPGHSDLCIPPDIHELQLKHREGPYRTVLVVAGAMPGTGCCVLSAVDNTPGKMVEQHLLENEFRLQIVLESSKESLWELDLATWGLELSRSFYTGLGYSSGQFDPTCHSLMPLLHPEDEEPVTRALERAREHGGGCSEMEFRLRAADATWRWMLARGQVIARDESGIPLRMIGTITDITRQKEDESRLRLSEKRYQNLFEYSPFSLFELDFSDIRLCLDILYASGVHDIGSYLAGRPHVLGNFVSMMRLVEMNEHCCTMFEAENKEHLANRLKGIFSGDIHPLLCSAFSALWEGRSVFEGELTFTALQGSRKESIMRLSLAPGEDERWSRVYVSFIDVTEKTKIAENLKQSEERFRTIVETAPSVLFILDEEKKIRYVSPNSRDVTGYSQEELEGAILGVFHEDDVEMIKDLVRRSFATGEGMRNVECRARRKDGKLVYLSSSWEVLRDDGGVPGGMVIQSIDCTEKKRAEKELIEREQILSAFMNAISEHAVLIGTDGKILAANTAFKKHFGIEDGAGANLFSFCPGPILERLQTHLEEAIQSNSTVVYEDQVEACWFEQCLFPITGSDGAVEQIAFISGDITGRKVAEQVLMESKAKYRQLADSITDIFFALDGDLRCTYWNPASERLIGVSAEAAIGKSLMDVLPSSPTVLARLCGDVLEDGTPRSMIDERPLPGTSALVEWTVYPSLDGISVFARDIAEKLQMERALRESEERYRSLVEHSPEAIFVHSDGRILYGNAATVDLFGVESAGDLIGKRVCDFFDRESRRALGNRITRSYVDRAITPLVEEKLVRIDGSVLDIEVASVPVLFDDTRATQEIVRDISRRKSVENKIREWNRHLSIINTIIRVANSSLILDETLEIILEIVADLLDFDFGWVYLKNRDGKTAEMVAHYGVPESFADRDRTIGVRDHPYNIVFYGGQSRFVENLPDNPPGIFESRIMEDVDALSFAGIPLIAESVVVGALYIGRREEVRFSENERSTLESIGKEIGGTILRGILQDQLEEAYDEMSCYLDIIEHDMLRIHDDLCVTTGIIGEMLDGQARFYAQKIEDTIARGKEIINNVAVIRRINDMPPDLGQVELDPLIRAEMQRFGHASISFEATGYTVIADEFLAEIFANLFGNSIKFGGPDVTIVVKAEEMDGKVLVSVEDTGCGIPDEQKQAVFTVFQRNSQKASGRGLGLHIARLLIERYCGSIWIEDRVPGKHSEGAAVRFTLVPLDE
ncbi:MAG: PAS domain S-box protein [Methanomicrobiaceae archaeon]|nr:PAS domain S-box protein [Methanomicrobiaceae archaeon]